MHLPRAARGPRTGLLPVSVLALTLVVVGGCAGARVDDPSTSAPSTGEPAAVVVASRAPDGSDAQPQASAPAPDAERSASPRPTSPPLPDVAPLQPPAFASRVVVADLAIDLPIISGDLMPPPNYPFCDVAAYVTRFNQPYETGVTYISAHAQRGMFAPLLAASERNDGAELIGKTVSVSVSDGRTFEYSINRVARHRVDYSVLNEISMEDRTLILQTSEGPYGTLEKLQVIAGFVGESTTDLEAANPQPMPRDCEPA